MNIAIVGPSHPYKGGITQQTTELAHRLAGEGHEVTVISWKSQFPAKLYPGTKLPANKPEMTPFPNTIHTLNWWNPLSWFKAGRLAKGNDQVIFIWWFPTMQGPIYSTIMMSLKKASVSVICHNVLPHEPRPGDMQLTSYIFGRADQIIVHTPEQAVVAASLSKTPVIDTVMPSLLPGWSSSLPAHTPGMRKRLLFFGLVRTYKGLNVLLQALAKTPDVALTIAGEFWGGIEKYETVINDLGLKDRVTILPGYVDNADMPQLFQSCDAMVMPYTSGTGTNNVRLSFAYGLPVITSDLTLFTQEVHDNVDGLIFKNGDADGLAAIITKFYEPATFNALAGQIPVVPLDAEWHEYVTTIVKK